MAEHAPPAWDDDYAQVMADWLVGFDLSYGPWYHNEWRDRHPAETDQTLAWEIRECAVQAVKAAILRATEDDDG